MTPDERLEQLLAEAEWPPLVPNAVTLEDRFMVVPIYSGGSLAGWDLYTPYGTMFAFAATPVEIHEKIQREKRERLFLDGDEKISQVFEAAHRNVSLKGGHSGRKRFEEGAAQAAREEQGAQGAGPPSGAGGGEEGSSFSGA